MRIKDVKPESFIHTVRCDKCGTEKQHDEIGFDEFVILDHSCGYATGDHDGDRIEVDMCFDCFKEVLGPYWRSKSRS